MRIDENLRISQQIDQMKIQDPFDLNLQVKNINNEQMANVRITQRCTLDDCGTRPSFYCS